MSVFQELKSKLIGAPRDKKSLAAEHLKRCPLCGALNSSRNQECFVCLWHGAFDHDPASIDAGLSDPMECCPELTTAMAGPRLVSTLWKFGGRLCSFIRNFLRSLIHKK